jgi:hypothetical protein
MNNIIGLLDILSQADEQPPNGLVYLADLDHYELVVDRDG